MNSMLKTIEVTLEYFNQRLHFFYKPKHRRPNNFIKALIITSGF